MALRAGHRFCPRRAHYRWVDESRLADPDASPFRDVECGALGCPYCIETALWKWTVAFERSEPERFAVFTQLTGDWQSDRLAIQTLHQSIRRGSVPGHAKVKGSPGFAYTDPRGRTRYFTGAKIESAYTVEAGARTGMVHLNLFWHGEFVPQAFLVEVARALGWGARVSVNKWEPVKAGSSGYGMKEARSHSTSGYGMKEARATGATSPTLSDNLQPAQAAFLARNGGRLMHTTRGFWRDGKGGESLGNQRAAFRAAMRALDQSRGVDQTAGSDESGAGAWVQYGPGRDVVVAHSKGCGNARSVPATPPDLTGGSVSAGQRQRSLWWDGDPSAPVPISTS